MYNNNFLYLLKNHVVCKILKIRFQINILYPKTSKILKNSKMLLKTNNCQKIQNKYPYSHLKVPTYIISLKSHNHHYRITKPGLYRCTVSGSH